jgi:hypothetical protein
MALKLTLLFGNDLLIKQRPCLVNVYFLGRILYCGIFAEGKIVKPEGRC